MLQVSINMVHSIIPLDDALPCFCPFKVFVHVFQILRMSGGGGCRLAFVVFVVTYETVHGRFMPKNYKITCSFSPSYDLHQ